MVGMSIVACAGNASDRGLAINQSASPTHIVSKSDDKKLVAINSLLVVPVYVDATASADIPSNIDLNAMLSKALSEELQIKIVHSTRATDLNKSGLGSSQVLGNNSDYLNDAKKMSLEGILITRVNNFSSRIGSAVGSTAPARVDLAMQILSTASRQVVWQSSYHFKDEALSDNLFKIKDRFADNKPKFRSAEELLEEGYRNSIHDFSEKRLAEFVK